MTSDNYVKGLVALVAWREENSNGINGCLAVCFVLRNRVKAGWFQADYYENIIAPNQFSSMTIRGDGQTIHYPTMHDATFLKLLQFVDGIMDDTLQDTLTQGAKYYADIGSPGFQQDGWFARNILQKSDIHPSVAKVGTTTYFL